MRRVKIESMEDMEPLPEGGWVEAPVGLPAKFVYSVDRENDRLTITLPEEVAKRIGDRLCATFDGGKIVMLLEWGAVAARRSVVLMACVGLCSDILRGVALG